jgi:hypothetical protein
LTIDDLQLTIGRGANGAVAVKATFALILALALCGGCRGKTGNSSTTQPTQPLAVPVRLDLSNMSEDKLLPYVGQRVTIIGFWYGNTKAGRGVYATRDGGDPCVTLQITSNLLFPRINQLIKREKEPVEATGILLHRQPPPNNPPSDPRIPVSQQSDVRFYFDLEKADIKFVNDAKEATTQPAQ